MDVFDLEVKVFKALAHPVRLLIVKKLSKQTLCVCEMNEDVEISQSNLSQHLKILRDAGILYSKKEGTQINYYINDEQEVVKLLHTVEKMIQTQVIKANQSLKMQGGNIRNE